MTKQSLIQTYFQRKQLLSSDCIDYNNHVLDLFHFISTADNIENDVTTRTLELTDIGTAQIIAKQSGIIAGIEEIFLLINISTNLQLTTHIQDGSLVRKNQTVLSLSGANAELLKYERAFLNILGRMSGIATETNKLTQIFPNIAATRKTPWMLLDKKAVAIGGGLTHRLSLSDWPMIKDNHLVLLKAQGKLSLEQTISQAIKKMREVDFFEIEVETQEQAVAALEIFAEHKKETHAMALLLDNFDAKNTQQTIEVLKKHSVYENIIIEASGNISESNVSQWITTGVDIISLGSLTHSSSNFDLSMKILDS